MVMRRTSVRRAGIVTSLAGLFGVVGLVVGSVAPAGACGGLVGENGTIQLVRTTTLSAYHDGVERYVTSFDFDELGSGASPFNAIFESLGCYAQIKRSLGYRYQLDAIS